MIKILLLIIVLSLNSFPQEKGFVIARLKYGGGGDWYNDPSAEVNLLRFIAQNTTIKTEPKYLFVDLSTDDIFSYPFLFMTGHGNISFSASEAKRLRTYLENGGFLYVDDDYGLDQAFRREIKKVFPDNRLIELPFSHPIYNCLYPFPQGPPKTHEHDKNLPQGFGIFVGDRMVLFYTFECNPSDGWADPEVHNDPQEKREEALKFGANIITYVLTH